MTIFYVHNNADWVQLVKQVAHTPLTSGDVVRINASFTLTTLIALTAGEALVNGNGCTITLTNDGSLPALFTLEGGTIRNLVVTQSGGTLGDAVLLQNGSYGTVTYCTVNATNVDASAAAAAGVVIKTTHASNNLSILNTTARISHSVAATGQFAGFAHQVLAGGITITNCVAVIRGSGTENVGAIVYTANGPSTITSSIAISQNTATANAVQQLFANNSTIAECMVFIAGTTPTAAALGQIKPYSGITIRDIYVTSFVMDYPFTNFAEISGTGNTTSFTLTRCCVVSSVTPTSFVSVGSGLSVALQSCVAVSGTTRSNGSGASSGTLTDIYAVHATDLSTTYWQDATSSHFSPYFYPMLKAFTVSPFTLYWTSVFDTTSNDDPDFQIGFAHDTTNVIDNVREEVPYHGTSGFFVEESFIGESYMVRLQGFSTFVDGGVTQSTPSTGDTWYNLSSPRTGHTWYGMQNAYNLFTSTIGAGSFNSDVHYALIAEADNQIITISTVDDWTDLISGSHYNQDVGIIEYELGEVRNGVKFVSAYHLVATQTIRLANDITFASRFSGEQNYIHVTGITTICLGDATFDGQGHTITLLYPYDMHARTVSGSTNTFPATGVPLIDLSQGSGTVINLNVVYSVQSVITLTSTTDWSALASILSDGVGLASDQTVRLGGNITFYGSSPSVLTLGAATFDGYGHTITLVYAGSNHAPFIKVTGGTVTNVNIANSFLGGSAQAVIATDDSYGTFSNLRLTGNCLGGGVVRCGVLGYTTLITQTDFTGFATETYAGGLFGTSASTVLPSAGGVYTESGASGISFTCENCTVTMQFYGSAGSMQGAIACVLAGPADLSSSITSIIRTCRSQVTHVYAAGDTGALVSYMTGGTLERCYATALRPQLFFVAKLKPGVSNAITLQNCYYINPVTENPNSEIVGAMFVKTVDAASKNVAIVQCYFLCGELPLSGLATTSRFLYSVTVGTLTLTRCFISADDNTAASTACYETLVSGSVPTPTAALANIQGIGGAAVLTS